MSELHTTLVRDIMHSDVATIAPDASVTDIVRMMHTKKLSCLVVDLGDVSKGLGIVTQKDILGVLVDPDEAEGEVRVEEVMTAPALSVSPDFGIPTCVQMMRMLGVRRVPVIENGKLIGIISFSDIFGKAVDSLL
jgi:CBS domain-containing protein